MDTHDIQGNIVAGFNTRYEALIAFAIRDDADRAIAARWIGGLAPRMATVDDVRSSREAMKDPARGAPPWVAVAISKRVIDAVLPSVLLSDTHFNSGMAAKKSAIGDETKPSDWVVGGPNHIVDLLLTVAANDSTTVEAGADDLVRQATAAGLDVTYRELGIRLPGEIEHFGFKDGISQPEIAGDRSLNGLPLGDFVFGYPASPGIPSGNPQDPIGFSRNGSLLVFRRLEQDVAAFLSFFEAERARLLPTWFGLTARHLAAMVVGRWPSGAPVSVREPSDPGPSPNDNVFDFHDDREATRCPFGAHIRKVNPRAGPRDVVNVPRILRRGIPFGPPYEADAVAKRGLLFIAYQASLKHQFVFLSGAWMNRPDRPEATGGFDLLVGRAANSRSMSIKGPTGEVIVTVDQSHWIKPTGGAYLFAPGRNALAMLAQLDVPHALIGAVPAIAVQKDVILSLEEVTQTLPERDGRLTIRRSGLAEMFERAEWPLSRLTSEAAAALPALLDLRHLDLAGEHFPTQVLGEVGVKQLASLRGLEHLAVHGAAVPGRVLRSALVNLPLLSSLDLRGADLADDDVMVILAAHPLLTKLSLGATTQERGPHRFHSGRLTDEVVQRLGSLRQLRSLSIRGLPINDASLSASHSFLAALEEFDGGETNIGDETVARLAPPARLRLVWMDQTQVTDRGIAPLAESSYLRDLNVSRTQLTSAAIDVFLAMGSLNRLIASGLRLSDGTLPNLKKAESLVDLDFGYTAMADESAATIACLPSLEKLSIASTRISSRGLTALASSALIELDAEGLRADTDAVAAICKMRRLRTLRICLSDRDWTPLADFDGQLTLTAPAPHVGSSPNGLVKLSLTGELSPHFCEELSLLPKLEELSISEGAEHLLSMADGGFPKLRSLVAESAGLDDTGLDLLGRAPSIEALFISGNALSSSLNRLSAPHLHTLELRDTEVDDRAVESIAGLPRLHCLDLPGTRVTPDGIAALVRAAANLQSLALDGRQMSKTVVNTLASCPTLIELYLYGQAVNDEVLKRLAPLQRLRELNLVGTVIADSSVETLISLSGLRTIRITGSLHSHAFVDRLHSSRPDMQLFIEIARGIGARPRR